MSMSVNTCAGEAVLERKERRGMADGSGNGGFPRNIFYTTSELYEYGGFGFSTSSIYPLAGFSRSAALVESISHKTGIYRQRTVRALAREVERSLSWHCEAIIRAGTE